MIHARHITKRFGAFTALDDVSLSVPDGRLVALLGPSGSGKTTLLRILAGLDHPDGGAVHLDGLDATGLKTRERRVGFVFQHYALFRHMSVAENVAFGLKVRKGAHLPAKAEIERRVLELLDLVHLSGLAGRYPPQLSGGQRQRVALARALAVEPRLLLLDEPFGALDAQVRKDLRRWLRQLHDEMGLTSVFVTHDQEEALELADEVVVMNKGRIEQIGSPAEIYDQPATAFVFEFLGRANRFDCRIEAGRASLGGWSGPAEDIEDGTATAFVRPHDIELANPGFARIDATIRQILPLGPIARVEAALDCGRLIDVETGREAPSRLSLEPGSRVGLGVRRATVFSSIV